MDFENVMKYKFDSIEITGEDKDLIGDALDFYQSCQGVFVSYDENMELNSKINKLRNKLGIL